ncbi:putative YigZ family protein [Anaerosolibacter carboniphilus]|uniref:Putative YigZ family protein n=1 Tax=Anaerosolibacter carboniphilus TaxID=1417629 RepID=A0A841KUT1_9FIRM|nr:YigZ family protein [Anaerosolibacter carboniphilus]MBB6215958.1 putative YigZ family protein [Anaerosolibacter carboniphilus]
MLKRYRTVLNYGEVEHIIEKSRFIGYVKPIQDEEEAIAFIEMIRAQHKNATHNVPVYIFGENDEIQRYSEDGEPSGTAGTPILDMLKKEEIKNTVIVVTRYFGGIKLGTGGLVRAYTSTAKQALHEARVIEKVLYHVIRIRIDYSLLGKVQNVMMNGGYTIKDTVFDEGVSMFVYARIDEADLIIKQVINLTNGKAAADIVDTLYLNEENGVLISE